MQSVIGTITPPNSVETIERMRVITLNAARTIIYDPRLKNKAGFINKTVKQIEKIEGTF